MYTVSLWTFYYAWSLRGKSPKISAHNYQSIATIMQESHVLQSHRRLMMIFLGWEINIIKFLSTNTSCTVLLPVLQRHTIDINIIFLGYQTIINISRSSIKRHYLQRAGILKHCTVTSSIRIQEGQNSQELLLYLTSSTARSQILFLGL